MRIPDSWLDDVFIWNSLMPEVLTYIVGFLQNNICMILAILKIDKFIVGILLEIHKKHLPFSFKKTI